MAKWDFLDAQGVKQLAKRAGWTRKFVTGANPVALLIVAGPYVADVLLDRKTASGALEEYVREETMPGIVVWEGMEAAPGAAAAIGNNLAGSGLGSEFANREAQVINQTR
jgi:hypothetical protein